MSSLVTKLCRDITQVEVSVSFDDAVMFLLIPLSSDLYFLVCHRSYLAPKGIVTTGQHAPSLTQERKPGDEIPGHNHTQALPVLTGRRWVVDLSVPLVILAVSCNSSSYQHCQICRKAHVYVATTAPTHTMCLSTGFTQPGETLIFACLTVTCAFAT